MNSWFNLPKLYRGMEFWWRSSLTAGRFCCRNVSGLIPLFQPFKWESPRRKELVLYEIGARFSGRGAELVMVSRWGCKQRKIVCWKEPRQNHLGKCSAPIIWNNFPLPREPRDSHEELSELVQVSLSLLPTFTSAAEVSLAREASAILKAEVSWIYWLRSPRKRLVRC